tara:strand:- start:668 stop:2971 length:2304 start_codon:yes stop_codon:yes gene_type:complete
MIRVLKSRATSFVVGSIATIFILPTAPFSFADDHEVDVEEVVVTATRREESVMDVPISVQSIGSDKLDLATYASVRNVYNLVPGATVTSPAEKPPERESIAIRGSGIIQANGTTSNQNVAYILDDTPYINIAALTPPPIGTFDLERVEVLRGPQGTTYSQQSTGGLVIMRTQPVNLSEFGYKVSAGGMTYTGESRGFGKTYSGIVNAPIIEGKLGVRFGYKSANDPGFASMQAGATVDVENPYDETMDTLRLKILYQPSDSSSFEISHTKWENESAFAIGGNIVSSEEGEMIIKSLALPIMTEQFPTGIPTNQYEIKMTSLNAAFDLGFASLSYNFGDVEAPKMQYNAEADYIAYGTNYGTYAVITDTPAESTSHELRLLSNEPLQLGGLDLSYILGYFTYDASNASSEISNFPAFGIAPYMASNIDELDASALYGEVTLSMTDQLDFTLGVRRNDEERNTIVDRVDRADGDTPLGPYSGEQTQTSSPSDYDATSHRIGFNYRVADEGIVFLTRSVSKRAPSILDPSDAAEIKAAGLDTLAASAEEPSQLTQTELGTKWTLMDGSLAVEAVYALGQWDSIPLGVRIPPNSTSLILGGTDADVESYELTLNYQVNENWSLTYAGAYTDTEVTARPSATDVPQYPTPIRLGGKLYNYNPNTHSFSVNFSNELTNGWRGYGSFDYTYRSKSSGFAAYTADRDATEYPQAVSPYKYSALTVGMEKGGVDVNLSITNMGDFTSPYLPLSSRRVDNLLMFPRAAHLNISYSTF